MPKIPAELRKRIIQKLLFTPEREAIWKESEPFIEKALTGKFKDVPEPERAYLFGSFTTNKPNPKDIDILARYSSDVNIDRLRPMISEGNFVPTGKADYVPYNLYGEGGDPGLVDIVRLGKEKYKDWKLIRILGLAGAFGTAAALLPEEEAEASPYSYIAKKFTRSKEVARELSSTAKDLIGKTLWDPNKVVKSVKKGPGDYRFIVFQDGTERKVTKDILTELMQEYGTKTSTARAQTLTGESLVEQAAKSLEYHLKRQNPFSTKAEKSDWLKTRQAHIKSMGGTPSPYVWVESHKVFIPSEWAKVLEEAGQIRIGKAKGVE